MANAKPTNAVLRLNIANGRSTILTAKDHGLGVVTPTRTQNVTNRPSRAGKPSTRGRKFYIPSITFTVLQTDAVASLFGGFSGVGFKWDVDWRPLGDGNGLPKYVWSGDLQITAQFTDQRVLTVTVPASSGYSDAAQ